MAQKTILVTGAAGYIGSVSTYLLLQKGYDVIALDNLSNGHQEVIKVLQKKFGKNRLKFHEVDIKEDISFIFKKYKNIDAVMHYAAFCLVTESMQDPYKYFQNNVSGTLNLLNHLTKSGINKIIFSSTCATFGEAQYIPIDENHPQSPVNPYGQSKKMAEEIIKWFGEIKGLNYVILRYFNVCGASDDGVIGDSKNPSVLLVQNAVRGVLNIEPFSLTCPEVKTKDKTPIRDYINVVDLNLAHIKALEYLLKGGQSNVFNLGTGKGNSVLEIVNTVQKATKTKFDVKKSEPRQGEYATMIASIKKAQKILGWKPERTIEDSINSLIKWYSAHPHGWNK